MYASVTLSQRAGGKRPEIISHRRRHFQLRLPVPARAGNDGAQYGIPELGINHDSGIASADFNRWRLAAGLVSTCELIPSH
jgi:hypothetical protein